jgi:hypothetical protein
MQPGENVRNKCFVYGEIRCSLPLSYGQSRSTDIHHDSEQ